MLYRPEAFSVASFRGVYSVGLGNLGGAMGSGRSSATRLEIFSPA
jgi:hypothetical protein